MKKFLLGFLLLIVSPSFKADAIYHAVEKEKPERIGNKFVYFEDPTNKIEIGDVLAKGVFKPTLKEVPSYNVTWSTVWAKIKLTGNSNANWFLCLDPAAYNQVSVFQKRSSQVNWEETTMGDAMPNEARIYPTSHFLFKLNLSETDTTLLLIKFRDYFPVTIDAKIAPLEQFIGLFHRIDLFNGICFGIMIMMLIYNLYLYITNKTIIYIYYVLYVFFSIIFTGYLGGYGLHIPEWFKSVLTFAPIIPPAGFGIFGLLFTLQLFKKNLSSRFKIVMKGFIVIAISEILLSITPYKHLSEAIIQLLGLLLGIISITAGFIALKNKNVSAKFYLLGFGAYMGCLFYLILSAQGIFNITSFTWQCLITGSMLESIFLSFALGDKFKLAQLEKEKAQVESLTQAMANEKLVKEQNAMLEQKVKERTLELREQKELVEEKNKEMVDSINYAKRIQNALITSEKYIEKTINRLKKD